MKKKILTVICLLVVLIAACFTLAYTYKLYEASGNKTQNGSDSSTASSNVAEEIDVSKLANAEAKNDVTPEGYGVERELTGELKSQEEVSGVGDIDFSGVGQETFEIIGRLAEDKEAIQSMVKKENKEYKSTIDWTYGDITINEYKALIVVCGNLYEDELNAEEFGRYTVEANIPPADVVDEMGIGVLFDVDMNGYLTIWVDMIIRDSSTETEVQEIKPFVLYYEGNAIKIKK